MGDAISIIKQECNHKLSIPETVSRVAPESLTVQHLDLFSPWARFTNLQPATRNLLMSTHFRDQNRQPVDENEKAWLNNNFMMCVSSGAPCWFSVIEWCSCMRMSKFLKLTNITTVAVVFWLLALISKPSSQLRYATELWWTHPHRPLGIKGLRSTYGPTSIKVFVALQLIKGLAGGVGIDVSWRLTES